MARDFVIGTFNLENLDDAKAAEWKGRVHAPAGATADGGRRPPVAEVSSLRALDDLLHGTPYEKYDRVHTTAKTGKPFAKRKPVIFSHERIADHKQYLHDFADAPVCCSVTADPRDDAPKEVNWERPILPAKIDVGRTGYSMWSTFT